MSYASADPAGDMVVVGSGSDTVTYGARAQDCTVRAIRANAAGAIQLMTAAGNIVVCNFLAGETRAIRAYRIYAANTTATGIEAYL